MVGMESFVLMRSCLAYMCGVCGEFGVNGLYGANYYTPVTPHIYTRYDTHMH